MLKDAFQSRISAALTPAAAKQFERAVTKYTDENSEILLTFDLSRRYSFADEDRKVLFDLIKVSEAEFAAEIKQSKQIYKQNKIQSNPFYLASMLTTSVFLSKKDDAHAKLAMQYMSLMMYTSIHKGLFQYNANKQVMDYTIAHLSQSYRLRKMTSLYAFLDDNASTAFETYRDRILRGTDADLTYVIDALWNRIKGKLKKIAAEFYKNHREGNYLNADTDSYSEEDYHEIDNNSFVIDRLVNKVYIKLIEKHFDNRLLKYAITQSDTSYQKLKNLIDDIIDGDDDGKMRKVISSIIEFYMLQSGKSADYIARGDFIIFMKRAYATNTDVPQMVFCKDQIDIWLNENMSKYGRTNFGKTARQSYRKSVYMFFVFMINMEAKIS